MAVADSESVLGSTNEPAAVLTDLDEHGVLRLTLNRPEKKNALDWRTLDALRTGIAQAADDAVRVVVLDAVGDAFSSGGDVTVMRDFAHDPRAPLNRLRGGLNKLVQEIHALPKPVVAVVHGDAHGAGAILAFQCDLTLAADEANFALAFRHVGLIPDTGGTWLLPRIMGLQRAKYHIWTGAPFTAAQAAQWGLILDSVPGPDLAAARGRLIDALARGPAATTALSKGALHANLRASLADALEREAHVQTMAFQTPEHREGRDAFLERRRANFADL